MQKIVRHKTNLLYIEDLDRLLSEGRASVFMLGTLILFKAFILCVVLM